jgi:hypothetical protein
MSSCHPTVQLFELAPTECQYVVRDRGRLIFCGEPTAPGRAYCPAHCSRPFPRFRMMSSEEGGAFFFGCLVGAAFVSAILLIATLA